MTFIFFFFFFCEVLDFYGNKLQKSGVCKVIEILDNSPCIKRVDLGNNGLKSNSRDELNNLIEKNKNATTTSWSVL